jgi:hypothetical protein
VLWTIIVILLAIWLFGVLLHIAGFFIHILLIIALVVLVYRLITRTT